MKRLLILSDVHAGRDCKEITGFHQPRPNPEFDRAFIDLLDFYTRGAEREWKLILGGDFIDFIEVVVVPGFRRLVVSFDVTDEEQEFGLGSEPERALVKLERTMTYHEALFARLGEFVREGGELILVRGNHDVELYWPKVQRVLRRTLSYLAFRHLKLEVDEAIEVKAAFQERIEFVPWFYWEENRVYFEHGHQYDPYCSFDHWLHPLSPDNPRRIDTPVSLFAMRYFVNLLSDFSADNADRWTADDYLRWIRQKGFGGAIYTGRMALGAIVRILEYGGRWSLGRVRAYTKEHTKQLRELAAKHGIRPGRLKRLHALHAAPVSRNLSELMRLLFIDRMLLGLGALFFALTILLSIESPWLELVGMIAVAGATWMVNRRLAPRRYFLPGPRQAQIANRIADIMRVPLVIMGHSHVRRVESIAEGRTYMNTGCWLPPAAGLDHVDPEKPCTCNLSHAVLEADGRAELRIFCKASKSVRLFDVEEVKPRPSSIPTKIDEAIA